MSHTRARFIARRAPFAAAAAAFLTVAAGATGFSLPHAEAHDVVVGGTPEPDSVVEEFPDDIVLEFSGIPQDSFNTVAVSDADSGEVLFSGEPTLDERLVTLDVPDDADPGPGNYSVGFQITSSDGHATRGSVAFEVAGATGGGTTGGETTETAAPAPTTDAAQAGEQTDSPEDQLLAGPVGWILGGVGVVLVLGVLVTVIAKNRNYSEE